MFKFLSSCRKSSTKSLSLTINSYESQSGKGETKLVKDFLRWKYKQSKLLDFLFNFIDSETMLTRINSHFQLIDLKEWIVSCFNLIGNFIIIHDLTVLFRHELFFFRSLLNWVLVQAWGILYFFLLSFLLFNFKEIFNNFSSFSFIHLSGFMSKLNQWSVY